jgi:flavin-dependent dehydrogenase
LSRAAYDVLIVGAGAAGLAAGRLLAEAGSRVAIIEARTRVGRRIWTQLEELKKCLLSCHAHDRQADEFTHGAYSYVPAGALDAAVIGHQQRDGIRRVVGEFLRARARGLERLVDRSIHRVDIRRMR